MSNKEVPGDHDTPEITVRPIAPSVPEGTLYISDLSGTSTVEDLDLADVHEVVVGASTRLGDVLSDNGLPNGGGIEFFGIYGDEGIATLQEADTAVIADRDRGLDVPSSLELAADIAAEQEPHIISFDETAHSGSFPVVAPGPESYEIEPVDSDEGEAVEGHEEVESQDADAAAEPTVPADYDSYGEPDEGVLAQTYDELVDKFYG